MTTLDVRYRRVAASQAPAMPHQGPGVILVDETGRQWAWGGAAYGPSGALTAEQVQALAALSATRLGDIATNDAVIGSLVRFKRPTVESSPGSTDRITTDAQSAAFLQCATLGQTITEIQALTTLGSKRAWVLDQLNKTFSRRVTDRVYLVPPYAGAAVITNFGEFSSDAQTNTAIVTALLQEQAPLRAKALWALSKLFVVSHPGGAFDDLGTPYCFGSWFDRLNKYVFGNWRDLIESITYSPHMSRMLTFYANRKGNALGTTQPDENYARELMQLFSIGLWELNQDGTFKLNSAGQRIPTYTNDDIRQVARCLTGMTRWDFNGVSEFYDRDDASSSGKAATSFGTATGGGLYADPDRRLVHYLPFYEYGAKQALGGRVAIAAGVEPEANLAALHDALFNHPNTAPFFAVRMIQHMVKSNPSPGYVERVAGAFIDNGQGVRGDLKAVWLAVLTDPEAAGDGRIDAKHFRVRDGFDLWANLTRSFGRVNSLGQVSMGADGSTGTFGTNFGPVGPRMQPSIFGSCDPTHSPPELDDIGVLAPEAQLWSDVLIARAANELIQVVITGESNDTAGTHTRISDYSMLPLTGTAAELIERVSLLLCGGRMSSGLRASMQSLIAALPVSTVTEQVNRVAVLLQCVVNSPDFWVQV